MSAENIIKEVWYYNHYKEVKSICSGDVLFGCTNWDTFDALPTFFFQLPTF